MTLKPNPIEAWGKRKKILRKWLRTGRERGGKTERESLSITGFHRMLRYENAPTMLRNKSIPTSRGSETVVVAESTQHWLRGSADA